MQFISASQREGAKCKRCERSHSSDLDSLKSTYCWCSTLQCTVMSNSEVYAKELASIGNHKPSRNESASSMLTPRTPPDPSRSASCVKPSRRLVPRTLVITPECHSGHNFLY
eukprot:3603609-Pleurochrysis_carterae.AAC.1